MLVQPVPLAATILLTASSSLFLAGCGGAVPGGGTAAPGGGTAAPAPDDIDDATSFHYVGGMSGICVDRDGQQYPYLQSEWGYLSDAINIGEVTRNFTTLAEDLQAVSQAAEDICNNAAGCIGYYYNAPESLPGNHYNEYRLENKSRNSVRILFDWGYLQTTTPPIPPCDYHVNSSVCALDYRNLNYLHTECDYCQKTGNSPWALIVDPLCSKGADGGPEHHMCLIGTGEVAGFQGDAGGFQRCYKKVRGPGRPCYGCSTNAEVV